LSLAPNSKFKQTVLESPKMIKTLTAHFDGTVLHPNEPLPYEPNTQVKITIETISPANQEAYIFLDTAQSLNLEGPPDWSTNLDTYLYGEKNQHEK
jgi:hypothetical protein